MSSFGRTAAALIVAASLFGYIYFVESKKDPASEDAGDGSSSPKREKVFAGFDKLKVKSLSLRKRNGELVELAKKGDAWTVGPAQESPADSAEVGTLLDALQNLQTEEIVNENATDFSPFGLLEPKVRVSIVMDGAAQPLEFDLGDSVPAGAGLFGRVPGKPRLFTVSSTLENTLTKSAFDLRDRSVLGLKRADIQSFEVVERGRTAFRLSRGGEGEDEWRIEAPIATRAARWSVENLLGLIDSLQMDSVASEDATAADLARFGLARKPRSVVLHLASGQTSVLEIGRKTDQEKYYAREKGSRLVAVIGPAVVEDLDRGLKNLRAARLLDVAAYEVNGLDVTASDVTRTFTKSTTKGPDGAEQILWKSKAPFKDATSEKMSDALFAVGGMEAAQFIDKPEAPSRYGLDEPALRVVLRVESGKKEDWFEVAVSGDAGFARRRGDKTILKLDKAKTEALIGSFAGLGS